MQQEFLLGGVGVTCVGRDVQQQPQADEEPSVSFSLQSQYNSLNDRYSKLTQRLRENLAEVDRLYQQQDVDKKEKARLQQQIIQMDQTVANTELQAKNLEMRLSIVQQHEARLMDEIRHLQAELAAQGEEQPQPTIDNAMAALVQELRSQLSEQQQRYDILYNNYINNNNQLIFLTKTRNGTTKATSGADRDEVSNVLSGYQDQQCSTPSHEMTIPTSGGLDHSGQKALQPPKNGVSMSGSLHLSCATRVVPGLTPATIGEDDESSVLGDSAAARHDLTIACERQPGMAPEKSARGRRTYKIMVAIITILAISNVATIIALVL